LRPVATGVPAVAGAEREEPFLLPDPRGAEAAEGAGPAEAAPPAEESASHSQPSSAPAAGSVHRVRHAGHPPGPPGLRAHRMGGPPMKRLAAVTLLGALALASCSFGGGGDHVFTAEFSRAVQVFPAVKVRVLGVDVGQVIDVKNGPSG